MKVRLIFYKINHDESYIFQQDFLKRKYILSNIYKIKWIKQVNSDKIIFYRVNNRVGKYPFFFKLPNPAKKTGLNGFKGEGGCGRFWNQPN